ncbi:MAG: hypothetical protein WBN68_17740 [Sedimenticolaceae bacterium]
MFLCGSAGSTIPIDEVFKLSGSYAWLGSKGLDFAIGDILHLIGPDK